MDGIQLDIVLKRLLHKQNLTMSEISKRTGIPAATLSGYLNGSEPSKLQHVRTLSKFFNLSMEELLFGESAPPTLRNVAPRTVFKGWLKVTIEQAMPEQDRSKSP